jgi:tRNA(Leu) C34 or U34 (ribose-2'-O)-methylase TrmL
MSRPLRYLPERGSLVEVTCRTLHARFLLRPCPQWNQIALGVLGRAQRLYGVEVHLFSFFSNHYHILATFRDARQMAAFMGYLNTNLAKEAGRLVCGAVASGGEDPFESPLPASSVLVVGSEGSGLPAGAYRFLDRRFTIPMRPPVDSLNAAVAAALILYSAILNSRLPPGEG